MPSTELVKAGLLSETEQEVEGEDANAENEYEIEGNTVAACCVLVFAVALDALTSLPTTIVVDIPASTRFSSLTMTALIAAPPIDCHYLFEQRGLGVILLVIVALTGLHHGGVYARIADASYAIAGGLALVSFYTLSGLKPGEPLYDGAGKRENVVALSAALMVYVGTRTLRSGLSHGTEVIQFTASFDDFTTRGYAVADDTAAFFNSFGGGLVVCSGLITLLNHDSIYEHGSQTVAPITAMLSVLVYTSAFVSMLSSFASMDDMAAIFGASACAGSADVCVVANRSRRLFMANTTGPTCLLIASAVAMTLLAFPKERRCQNKKDYYSADEMDEIARSATGSGIVSVLAVLVAIAATFLFGDASSLFAGVEVFLLYVSIPFAWFGNSSIACALHVAGQLTYTAQKLGSPLGFDLNYFTHWCTLCSMYLLFILTVSTAISKFLYASCCCREKFIDWVDTTTAVCLILLTSIQMLLTLLTLSAVAGFDGSLMHVNDTWAVFALEWAVQHTLTFFFAAALVGGRYEIHNPHFPSFLIRLVWIIGPVLVTIGWFACVTSSGANPYESYADMIVVAIGTISAVVPWGVIGWNMC